MAIMWDARAGQLAERDETATVAWKLQFAQILAASGFEPAVIKEAIVMNETIMKTSTSEDDELTNRAAA